MSDGTFKCGTIYWPLLSIDILRSEMVSFLSSKDLEKENELICPFIKGGKCFNTSKKSSNGRVFCFINTNKRQSCRYYKYHKYFLLIKDSVTIKKCIEYVDSGPKLQNSYSNIYGSTLSVDEFSKTLCYFPQYNITILNNKLLGFNYVGEGHPEKYFFQHNGIQIKTREIKAVNTLIAHSKFYAKSEYHLTQNKVDSTTSSSAFTKLINIDVIKKRLPKDNIDSVNPEHCAMHPVTLSFFADKRADALLSLVISYDTTEEKNGYKTSELLEQALGSIHNDIYSLRQEFLEKWCMTLGDRVDDICREQIKAMSNDAQRKYISDADKRQNEAKKVAMLFAFNAICEMAKILAVQKPDKFPGNAPEPFIYNPKKQPSGQISTYIEKYYLDSLTISPDRKGYVTDFCQKAEMYAEEFVSSEGKLKGRLSAPTVKKLKNISQTSNPVNARILIKGEAGGGKGVAADDFHFYCMKRIANNKKDKDKYFKEVNENITNIFRLPANYIAAVPGASANLFFRQISNTGWWLWNRELKDALFKTDIQKFLETQKQVIALTKTNDLKEQEYFTKDDGSEDKLIEAFSKLLEKKIALEIESKTPDFSFNFFQVNCGILGGENSELAEAIERLFGKVGDYEKAMPGLFQTCSYIGGTLFLDEIADAPIRVQDNLLRPLEEGKVSRPGWETFDEKVDNIRIVGATFKDLFKNAQQYQETLSSGQPKGFRPDLLTRLTRNPPVPVSPVWKYFVLETPTDNDFHSQFAFVCNNSWEVSTKFWIEVYYIVSKQINEHCQKARHHIPGGYEGRRKFASKITMRLFKEVGKIARLKTDDGKKPKDKDPQKVKAQEYLSRMLDYLLTETN